MKGIARLAQELGISTGTVSRALNGKPDVSGAPQTYCEALGYTIQTRDNADGSKTTVCIFPDGLECEETAFLQGIIQRLKLIQGQQNRL